MLVVTTAPPARWPAGAQPLGPTDAPPYLLRIAPWKAADFARACAGAGHAFEEAANVHEAGLMMRRLLRRPGEG